ncbi:hypothetical protein INT80_05420 [Gallibacterium anatis]|uniref:Uncharacterized protein n=1 Tax=Gallibacterium anatis TaxID=750 RepID=A0A930UR83_9PAST|nr:hypothetical protein [Gallibacterium anatis]
MAKFIECRKAFSVSEFLDKLENTREKTDRYFRFTIIKEAQFLISLAAVEWPQEEQAFIKEK